MVPENLLLGARQKQFADSAIAVVVRTREMPRLTFVEVDLRDGMHFEVSVHALPCQIVGDKLFVCGMETETWWQPLHWLQIRLRFAPACIDLMSTTTC